MASVNWNNIRPLNGSQNAGFEELCAQLARLETPRDAKFTRTGNPDAGVEGYCVLPSGDEWCWQAKYFFSLGPSQWAQIDDSVETALDKHPNIKRYYVCVPIDRADARVAGRTSAMDRWQQRVQKWVGWAQQRNMQVDFVWWGSSELVERLSQPQQIARLYYWFGNHGFDHDWFHGRLAEAIEAAGPRYNPQHHVELDIAESLEDFARTVDSFNRMKSLAIDVRQRGLYLKHPRSNDHQPLDIPALRPLMATVDAVLDAFRTLEFNPTGEPEVQPIQQALAVATGIADKTQAAIADLQREYETQRDDGEERPRHQRNPYSRVVQDIRGLEREFDSVEYQLSQTSGVSNKRLMILKGSAGTGKTHLMCDFARRRIDADAPVVLLMGQRFTDTGDPWRQLLEQVGMHGETPDTFVGALEAAAQSANSRALLMIDAVNEGRGRDIWPSNLAAFLSRIQQSQWIATILSVRRTYERSIIPEHIGERAASITHFGFRGHEYEATRIFFEHHGIEFHSTPILYPEFANPLYLKTICRVLQSTGQTRLPRGRQGITTVLDSFIDVTNGQLANRLDYDPRENLVGLALRRLAERFLETGDHWLIREDAAEEVNGVLPGRDFSRSLYRGMVDEGMLLEDMREPRDGDSFESVSIAFERFADHVVAEVIMQQHLDRNRVSRVFESLPRWWRDRARGLLHLSGGKVTGSIDGSNSLVNIAEGRRFVPHGVIEALCIQAPERTGRELVCITPQFQDLWGIGEAFLESIIWRELSAFSEETRLVLNELDTNGRMDSEPTDTLITVSSIPGHPFNVEFLDRRLRRDDMPERDAWWSTYLHHIWGDEGPVDRLVEWASNISPSDTVDEEVVDLAATTLGWMLPTPSRFLRDRATKALVALLTGRLKSLDRLVNRFADVDDPYVVERIYAVAYGFAMRSNNATGIGRVAQSVYRHVFADGTPPAHLLLRDYARGVIERAAYLGAARDLDLGLVRPPYQSTFPEVPDEQSTQDLILNMERSAGGDTDRSAWDAIPFSVRRWDFARYILGTNSTDTSRHWLSIGIDQQHWLSADEREEQLIPRFNGIERNAWEDYVDARQSVPPPKFDFLPAEDEHEDPDREDGDAPEPALDSYVQLFKRLLTHQADPSEIDDAYCRFVATLSNEHWHEWAPRHETRPGFDLQVIQRFILHRVVALGWTERRFGRFDNSVRWSGSDLRRARKPERMGKKYQWIAYHEILAFMADHHQYHEQWETVHDYQGPWQVGRRDIDPSTIVNSRRREDEPSETRRPTWWAPLQYDNWQVELPITSWTANASDVPTLDRGLLITDPNDPDTRWVNAYCFQIRSEPTPPDIREYDVERKEVWTRSIAFLVPRGKADDFVGWVLTGEYSDEHWPSSIPDFGGSNSAFLGEYAWAPAFEQSGTPEAINAHEWCHPSGSEPSVAYGLAAHCTTAGSEYDCSADEDSATTLYLPSHLVVRGCRLTWTGIGADYVDDNSMRVAFDPSAHEPGPNALLLRLDLLETYLSENDLELCWAVTGEKQSMGTTGQPYGWLQFHGAYVLRGGKPEGRSDWLHHAPPI